MKQRFFCPLLTKNAWIKVLVLTNVVSIAFLVIVSLHYKVPQKIVNRLFLQDPQVILPKEYSGYIYPKEIIESLIYRREGFEIIMLGDSLTCHNNWGELLDREDIANYGIGGDTTKKIIERINDITLVSPSKCFLMVGINDILSGRPVEEILKNYEIILEYLTEYNINVMILSVLPVSELSGNLRYDWRRVNREIFDLNKKLEDIAKNNNMQYIDISRLLSDDNKLNNQYTSGDGIHLNRQAYEIWGNEIKKYL